MQQGEVAVCAKKTGSLDDLAVIGVDIGKDTFHMVGFDRAGQLVMRKQIKRLALQSTFEQLARCIVGMEACLPLPDPPPVPVRDLHGPDLLATERIAKFGGWPPSFEAQSRGN